MKCRIIDTIDYGAQEWLDYVEWAGLKQCSEYYSIDSIIRESLFLPESAEDWDNCVNEDNKIDLITNYDYAQKVLKRYPQGEIVGVIIDPLDNIEHVPENCTLLGYDILDEFCDVSVLTNWGGKDEGIQNLKLNCNALLDDIKEAYEIKEELRKEFPQDPHTKKCEVWAIYKVKP